MSNTNDPASFCCKKNNYGSSYYSCGIHSTPLIDWGGIHFVAASGGGSNQFQGIGLVTSSLTTTEQKYRRLRGRVVSTVGNTLSLLNWRRWFGGSLLLDKYTLKQNLLHRISTILQSTTQDVKVSRFHILIHLLTSTYVYSNLLQLITYTSFLHEVRTNGLSLLLL